MSKLSGLHVTAPPPRRSASTRPPAAAGPPGRPSGSTRPGGTGARSETARCYRRRLGRGAVTAHIIIVCNLIQETMVQSVLMDVFSKLLHCLVRRPPGAETGLLSGEGVGSGAGGRSGIS